MGQLDPQHNRNNTRQELLNDIHILVSDELQRFSVFTPIFSAFQIVNFWKMAWKPCGSISNIAGLITCDSEEDLTSLSHNLYQTPGACLFLHASS